MSYITDEMRSKIGIRTPKRTAEPIGEDTLRRFVQATMEENPIHFDEKAGASSRFGSVVAPPLYPVHAMRRASGTPDPLDRAKENPDWDGSMSQGQLLPPLNLPFVRHLNGGSEVEFFRFAKVGDVVSETSAYAGLEEKESKSGPIVLVITEMEYTNQDGEVLLKVRKTGLHR